MKSVTQIILRASTFLYLLASPLMAMGEEDDARAAAAAGRFTRPNSVAINRARAAIEEARQVQYFTSDELTPLGDGELSRLAYMLFKERNDPYTKQVTTALNAGNGVREALHGVLDTAPLPRVLKSLIFSYAGTRVADNLYQSALALRLLTLASPVDNLTRYYVVGLCLRLSRTPDAFYDLARLYDKGFMPSPEHIRAFELYYRHVKSHYVDSDREMGTVISIERANLTPSESQLALEAWNIHTNSTICDHVPNCNRPRLTNRMLQFYGEDLNKGLPLDSMFANEQRAKELLMASGTRQALRYKALMYHSQYTFAPQAVATRQADVNKQLVALGFRSVDEARSEARAESDKSAAPAIPEEAAGLRPASTSANASAGNPAIPAAAAAGPAMPPAPIGLNPMTLALSKPVVPILAPSANSAAASAMPAAPLPLPHTVAAAAHAPAKPIVAPTHFHPLNLTLGRVGTTRNIVVKAPSGALTITTDQNVQATYQMTTPRFAVKPGDTIRVLYGLVVQPGGRISLGLLNTAKKGWYGVELILGEGTYSGTYERVVPAKEIESSLVFRNYHLEKPGQSTFTIYKYEVEIQRAPTGAAAGAASPPQKKT